METDNIKKIVLISSTQPSLNPRLVKEADALCEAGYNVVVVYQFWNNWASDADKKLLLSRKWKAIRVGGSITENRLTYNITRLIHKFFQILRRYIPQNPWIAALALTRCYFLLLKKAASLKGHLYIGHNPGALAIAVKAAYKNRAKCGFDAEDFHRYEYSSDEQHLDVVTKKLLEETYFPKLDYITTASPLISSEYKKLFPRLKFSTILNVFPKQGYKSGPSGSILKLFWFSQTVGANRGIEEIIEAVGICNNANIHLHLLGFPRQAIFNKIDDIKRKYQILDSQITHHMPIPADSIFQFASQFDVGMATEFDQPFNRNICLTNKIFTYLQSGLAVIASETEAQRLFFSEFSTCGKLFKIGDSKSLAYAITTYFENRQELEQAKAEARLVADRQLSWNVESKKFLDTVNRVLVS